MSPRVRILLLLALFGLLAGPAPARAQLSPGPLAGAHAALDKPTACLECHVRGKPMEQQCLACHQEIGAMKAANRGFHARDGKGACATCHPDHAGRDFQLVRWDEGAPEKFDHTRAGFELRGKHATLECAKCHKPALQKGAVVPKIRVKDRTRTWLGLETQCASCHDDPHRGQLGARCESCHDEKAWKPAPGFDHAKSEYPLTGKHAEVACAKCHAAESLALPRDANGAPIPQWKPLPHADCVSCHRDPHVGRFKGACASCHRTDGWSSISPKGFNHDVTRYPLRGKHAAVECAKCHDPKTAWGKKPLFATCMSCHKDAHAGQATIAGKPQDCAACHRVEGYTPSTFTVAQHAKSKYPLEGGHATAECATCHVRRGAESVATLGPARVVMRPATARCAQCHADPHAGRFSPGGARARANDCVACHRMSAFRPSAYDAAAHDAAGFKLTGAHRAVPCLACHAELKLPAATSSLLRPGVSSRALRFEDAPTRCDQCHKTPHGDQFAARADGGACDVCHGDEAWSPASRFDHNRHSSYKLEGAHARTKCSGCHASVRGPDGRPRTIYRPLSSKCESCHTTGVPAEPKSGAVKTSVPGDSFAWKLMTTRGARDVLPAR